ncbi:MAG: hypothetical protein LRZ94_00905 [Candidatus Pacebacteria bacterium]|nr:hypothetical protein [Candidatus Paceibacterota bacterium]
MKETIQPLKTWCLYLKSHCEAPDFEVEVQATDKQDAFRQITEKWYQQLGDIDISIIWENLGCLGCE